MLSVIPLLSNILLLLAPLVVLALTGLALASVFTFGGARRNALALLAAGVFSAITGAVYLYGVVASYYALQDNAYLGNIYVGLLLVLFGVCALIPGGLVGAGLNRWAALGLALVGLAGLVGVYKSFGLDLPYGGQFVALYLVAALVMMTGALLLLRRADLLGGALGLGVFGAVIALALFAIPGALTGSRSLAVYTQFGVDRALADKPPILEGFGAAMTLLVAAAVYFLGRRRGGASHAAGQRVTATA
jgi:hypothetical protein